MRAELAKGRTREEIRTELVSGAGWAEADLSEAFRVVIPMQGFGENSVATKTKKKISLHNLIFIIVGILLVVVWYFYQTQIMNFLNSGFNNIKGLTSSYFEPKIPPSLDEIVVVQDNVVTVKDCGVGTAPDLKSASTYQNDPVLNCLGSSALYCEDATAILVNPLFPTVFQVVKNKNSGQNDCNFKLSYAVDGTLVDITGRKLAGQSIMCPLGVVKVLDETKKVPSFNAPSINNLGQYASQIYFYGTLSLFIENNVEKSKILALGCSGSYIDSVVASYKKVQDKR
jgi:hypothetical protein